MSGKNRRATTPETDSPSGLPTSTSTPYCTAAYYSTWRIGQVVDGPSLMKYVVKSALAAGTSVRQPLRGKNRNHTALLPHEDYASVSFLSWIAACPIVVPASTSEQQPASMSRDSRHRNQSISHSQDEGETEPKKKVDLANRGFRFLRSLQSFRNEHLCPLAEVHSQRQLLSLVRHLAPGLPQNAHHLVLVHLRLGFKVVKLVVEEH